MKTQKLPAIVIPPGMLDAEFDLVPGYWAVEGDEGIIAWFQYEADACAFAVKVRKASALAAKAVA